MNKLNKIGVSALCGSLAAISAANAGDLTVTGGADMTWMSQGGVVTGNPLGLGSNFGFAGSGELENGWTVDLSIAHTNGGAYSNASVTVGVPGLGDILFNQGGSGTGIQRLDDITPTVWEEADGATVRFAWSPDSDGEPASDKAVGGTSGTLGSGWDLTVEASSDLIGVDGLTLYGGISSVEQFNNATAVAGDSDETVMGIKYAAGGFTVGYQISDDDTGNNTTNTKYENTSYSVTFNVNDDLSIGYAHIDSDKTSTTNVTAEADSLQAAYTMGGATFRIAEVDVTDQSYQTTAAYDTESTIISLGLAF